LIIATSFVDIHGKTRPSIQVIQLFKDLGIYRQFPQHILSCCLNDAPGAHFGITVLAPQIKKVLIS
jgi:hypothetical protein